MESDLCPLIGNKRKKNNPQKSKLIFSFISITQIIFSEKQAVLQPSWHNSEPSFPVLELSLHLETQPYLQAIVQTPLPVIHDSYSQTKKKRFQSLKYSLILCNLRWFHKRNKCFALIIFKFIESVQKDAHRSIKRSLILHVFANHALIYQSQYKFFASVG